MGSFSSLLIRKGHPGVYLFIFWFFLDQVCQLSLCLPVCPHNIPSISYSARRLFIKFLWSYFSTVPCSQHFPSAPHVCTSMSLHACTVQLLLVACRAVWMSWENSYETSWLDALHHPIYCCLSILLFWLDAHLHVEIFLQKIGLKKGMILDVNKRQYKYFKSTQYTHGNAVENKAWERRNALIASTAS